MSIVVPVVCSFAMPCACAIMQHASKYTITKKGSSAGDYANAYWVVFSVVLQVGCIIKFTATSAVFDWNLWTIGSIGSLLNCWGGFFATSAIGTGKPAGPMAALFSSQVILVTIYSAIRNVRLPHWM